MNRLFTFLILMMIVLAAPVGPAQAVLPDEVLDDPALEARARAISIELRCVVCQNQSIDDSDAEIARDLRLLVRERLVAGDSDEQVLDYIVARYGDFVLLRPPWQPNTYMLWLAPPLMAFVIATLAVMFFRNYQIRKAAGLGPDPLSPDDRAELHALVERIAVTTPPASGQMSQFRAELAEGLRPHPDEPGEDESSEETDTADELETSDTPTPDAGADESEKTR
jgi:cytochrome c-type biogenesis protein CcmH